MLVKGIVSHHDCIGALAQHGRECRLEFANAAHFDRDQHDACSGGSDLHLGECGRV
jgi:hypothetical protein